MVTFLFSVHTIIEANQYGFEAFSLKATLIFTFNNNNNNEAIRRARQGGARAWARAVDLPARSFDPGVATGVVLDRIFINY